MRRPVSNRGPVKVINRQRRNNVRSPERKWNALDPSCCHPFADQDRTQRASQQEKSIQHSHETIVIKDSCDIEVSTTEIQAVVNLQVAIQAAIALVISISIADDDKAELITQELTTSIKSSQFNRQDLYIENSRNINVTTQDTDIAINAQLLLLVLIAILFRLDIL